MRVHIVGDTPLADAIRVACDPHHDLVVDADVAWLACQDVPERIDAQRVVLSSPWPVGTCARLEDAHPGTWFAVVPENMRERHAIKDFAAAESLVVGQRHWKDATWLVPLLKPLGKELLYMSPESAEMVKHARNSFLAATITFANEIADIAKKVGADPVDITRGLLADPRINGYLLPGDPPGGHLTRDVETLKSLGAGRLIGAL